VCSGLPTLRDVWLVVCQPRHWPGLQLGPLASSLCLETCNVAVHAAAPGHRSSIMLWGWQKEPVCVRYLG
jgi:hypothetical protein